MLNEFRSGSPGSGVLARVAMTTRILNLGIVKCNIEGTVVCGVNGTSNNIKRVFG